MAGISVTTKGGDKGMTSLGSGERVPKDDARVELYGTIDECQAALGLARSLCEFEDTAQEILFVEENLFKTMSYFAECGFPEPDAAILECMAESVSSSLPEEMSFVRPGDTRCGAALHLARTIARRAERTAARLYREQKVTDGAYAFLNRLSDLIYVLALKVDRQEKSR